MTLTVLVWAWLLGAAAQAQAPCEWQTASDGPLNRVEAPATVIDGRLIVLGGFSGSLQAQTRVDAYDPAADTWSSLADLPTPVTHSGLAVDDRKIWIAGGFVGNHPGSVVADVWNYDVDLDQWAAGPALPAPRGSGGLFRIDRELHFVGGVDIDRDTDMAEHWWLDLDSPSSWSVAPPLPLPRNHFGALEFGGRGYVLGGQLRHDTSPTDVALVHAYDPQSGWTQLADLPFPRSHFEPGTFLHDGRIIIGGGRSNTTGQPSVADVTAYDPVSNTWTALSPLTGPLLAPCVQKVGGELVLSGGGPTALSPTKSTWKRPIDGGASPHLRVNSGGGSLALAESWCADFGTLGGVAYANTAVGSIAGTSQDELYETERTGSNANPQSFAYSIPLVNGDYHVRLHFAEVYWGAPGGSPVGIDPLGKRVFDVLLEGQLVLDDYDIAAQVGPATADVREFDALVTDGHLDLAFLASVDRPKLSALEIIRLSSDASYCSPAAHSGGLPAELNWGGSPSVTVNDFTLLARECPTFTAGLFMQAASQSSIPLGSGTLCVGPNLFRLLPLTFTDATGAAQRTLDLAHPHLPAAQIGAGTTWNFQYYFRDTALATSNFTNALSVSFTP